MFRIWNISRQVHVSLRNTAQLGSLAKVGGDPKLAQIDFKIKRIETIQSISSSLIAKSNVTIDDLSINLNGKELVMGLTWLRDSCHCDQCTHQHSRQRLYTAKDFRRQHFDVDQVYLSDSERSPGLQPRLNSNQGKTSQLGVKWLDGHESWYPLDWIIEINTLFKKPQIMIDNVKRQTFAFPNDDFYLPSEATNVRYEPWKVSELVSKLTSVDYGDLIDGFEFSREVTSINANNITEMSERRLRAMVSLTRQLVTLGLAKIVHVPLERNQVLNVARSLAYERPTGYGTVFDVVVEPSEEINLAYSTLEFDLHSDLTYREMSPGVQLLHCIRNSIEGGFSYFSDAFKAAEELRQLDPGLFEILLQFPATFVVRDPYRNVKFRHQKPVITLDFNANLREIYYSPFMLPPIGHKEDVKLFYLAMDEYTKILQSSDNKLIAKMDPGDLFIFHNRRVLHGRSSYDATASGRFLQGCYMDWDEISCLNEKLNDSLKMSGQN